MSVRKPIIIVALVLVAFLVIGIVQTNINRSSTVTAEVGVIEDMFQAEGVLVWNEMIVSGSGNGTLETHYSNGARVAKGTRVATMHTGEVNTEIQQRLNAVNERIAELESQNSNVIIFAEDATKLESMITERSKEIIAASSKREYSKIQNLKEDINLILDKKAMLGSEEDSSEATLEKLYQEKEGYEKELSGVAKDLYSPMAGDFSTNVDGYETVLTPDGIENMTVADIETILDNKKEDEEKKSNQCKIVDDYMWYFTTVIDESIAKGLKADQSISVRNALTGDESVSARVHFVGAPENGKCVLTVRSTFDIGESAGSRYQTFDIIVHRYEGFKIPTRALRVIDGQQGVYVRKENGDVFRPVELKYKGAEYMIIKVNEIEGASVTLYDEVVVRN